MLINNLIISLSQNFKRFRSHSSHILIFSPSNFLQFNSKLNNRTSFKSLEGILVMVSVLVLRLAACFLSWCVLYDLDQFDVDVVALFGGTGCL